MGEGLEFAFWMFAIIGTTIFVLKMLLLFMGLGDHDAGDLGHVDVHGGTDVHDAGMDGDDHGSTSSFTVLSLQSLATFFMGAGWMGLVALKSWGLDRAAASMAAAGFGAFLVWLLGMLLHQAMKLESSGTLDTTKAVGHVGKVYSRIPSGGRGQIQVEIQGRLMTLDARSSGDEILTGTTVKVDAVDGSGTLLVSPAA